MTLQTGYSLCFPIFGAKEVGGGAFVIEGDARGTAFSLGGNFMMTAGHVASGLDLHSPNCAVVGLSDGKFFKAARITDAEQLHPDVAILTVDFSVPESKDWFHRLRWSKEPLQPLHPVRAMGYAYGLHAIDEKKSVVVRGFQGYVVSGLEAFRPVGASGEPYGVYELSFAAPRGLSGAPLLNTAGTVIVHGIVIGNSETRMRVFRSEERIEENGNKTMVEQYEALTLGIAVKEAEVFGLSSRLLGGSVQDHLSTHGLLV